MSAETDESGPIDAHSDGRLVFPNEVLSSKVIAVLPDVPASDLMAPIEAMIQEKVRVFTLPVADADRRRAVLKIYRRRAVIGVHGVMAVDDVQGLVNDKVAFALPVAATPDLLDALRQAGIPAAPDARLTWVLPVTATSSPGWHPGLPSSRAAESGPMRCVAGWQLVPWRSAWTTSSSGMPARTESSRRCESAAVRFCRLSPTRTPDSSDALRTPRRHSSSASV